MNDHRTISVSDLAAMPKVSGSTSVYLILGNPVEQVRAPETFNLIFASLGIDAVLVPVQIAPANLVDFVRTAFLAPNIKGLWVTIPHKALVLDALDQCTELGQLANAVNAVRRNADGTLEGSLFDGEGFISALHYFNIDYLNRRVLVIGAGGAAAAIGASLALPRGPGKGVIQSAAREVVFFDPMPGKAAEVAARIASGTGNRVSATLSSDPAGFDLIVNASPLGLNPSDPLPCDVKRMAPHAALVDIVMKNQPTPVVQAARARGHNAQPGFEMLIQQAHLYLDFFGFTEAAQAVRADATALRLQIYPPALRSEVHEVYQDSRPPVAKANFVPVV